MHANENVLRRNILGCCKKEPKYFGFLKQNILAAKMFCRKSKKESGSQIIAEIIAKANFVQIISPKERKKVAKFCALKISANISCFGL
jgi:hypothetical protein